MELPSGKGSVRLNIEILLSNAFAEIPPKIRFDQELCFVELRIWTLGVAEDCESLSTASIDAGKILVRAISVVVALVNLDFAKERNDG